MDQDKNGADVLTVEPSGMDTGRDGRDFDIATRTTNQQLEGKDHGWIGSVETDKWRHDNLTDSGTGSSWKERSTKQMEQLETSPNGVRVQLSGSGDSNCAADLHMLRRLSGSDNKWRTKDNLQTESRGWQGRGGGGAGRDRSHASESSWQPEGGSEAWRASIGSSTATTTARGQESTSWRSINEYMRGGSVASTPCADNWRQQRDSTSSVSSTAPVVTTATGSAQDDNWRLSAENWRNSSGESWRTPAASSGLMFAGMGGIAAGSLHTTQAGVGAGSNTCADPSVGVVASSTPVQVSGMGGVGINSCLHPGGDSNAWQNMKYEDNRLSQDLLRLKDRYMRDECGSRDGASGLSRESSRDDINSVCDQQFEYEERFRVDRRKLELMMIGSGDTEFGEAATAFFEKIGAETETVVIWPSRLKIGAKSKKDPHIRVGGQEEGVKFAKARITEVLDTRVNSRVTMKMDVSYTDHSHIIGKGGNTIRRVMSDTACHIHFPDSNRSNPNEKSNQVSIAGEMAGVERARARVRELTPLIFQFDLAIVPSFNAAPDHNNTYLRAIQDQYNVQVSFRQKQKNFHTTTVVIKGCELEASRVKEATLLLMDHLCPNNAASSPVNMTMEISPGHHIVVVGKGSINLRVIMQRTNSIIIFPDAGDPNIPPIRKGSVTISGAIHNVYIARQLLLGSLPIVMMFDLPDNIDVQESVIQKLQDENEVTITIKPKARQTNKSVIIKSQERNVAGMYIARHKLLDLDGEVVRAEVPETYKVPLVGTSSTYHLASLPATRGPFLCPTTQLQALGSPLSPNFIPPPCFTPVTPTFPPGSPWHLTTAAAAAASLPLQSPSDLARLGAPNYQSIQDYMIMIGIQQQQQEKKHQQQLQQQQLQQQIELEKKQRAWTSPQQNLSRLGPSGSDLGSSMTSSPVHSPRNSSPVNAQGNLTHNLHKMELTSSSGIEANHSDLSAIMADFPELSCTDRRAPGCEKKVAEFVDYEQARIRANQAIQHKPSGEERKPNPSWAGLGFSSSMPESVLREKSGVDIRRRGDLSQTGWITNMEQIKEAETGQEDLEHLLQTAGLSKYAEVFQRHEIDLQTFATLTEDELKEIGINTFGPRKKLLMLCEKVRNLQ